MFHTKEYLLGIAAIVVLSGCSSPEGSTPPAETIVSTESPTAPAPAAVPVDPKVAQAALANASVKAKLRGLALYASAAAGVSSPKAMYAVAAADHQVAERMLSG